MLPRCLLPVEACWRPLSPGKGGLWKTVNIFIHACVTHSLGGFLRKEVVVLNGGSWTQLTPLYEARSVALVGASRSEVSVSGAVMRNILEGGYKGEVYPVNPKADRVMGLKAYPSVSKIPADVDMAVIMVPAQRVPE
nr:hypothetical protein [Candidatus Bathyarchaeota archaeon]